MELASEPSLQNSSLLLLPLSLACYREAARILAEEKGLDKMFGIVLIWKELSAKVKHQGEKNCD